MNKKSVRNVTNLEGVTVEVRRRLVRVTTALQAVTQNRSAFANPRGVYLEVVLAIHELEAARALISNSLVISERRGERQ